MSEPDRKSAPALFQAALPELRAEGVPEASPRTAPDRALAFATRVHDELTPVLAAEAAKPEAERAFTPSHLAALQANVAGIIDAALVFYGADSALGIAVPVPDSERKEVADKVRNWDVELFGWLWAKLRKDTELRPLLERIRSGQGRKDDAEDVMAQVGLARRLPEDQRPWTLEQLAEAETDATRQLQLLKQSGAATDEARVLRNRAWARFAVRYEQLRGAGLYLTGDEQRFPKLSSR